MGYIKENPIEEVDKPEKNQFIGKFYNADELSKVIELTKGTQLEVPVLMGGFYGLRRSEIVGLRWSVFDFENDVFYINHTVTTPRIDGKLKIVAKDRAKTKSSLRALPLDAGVKKRLLEIKERQEAYQRKFKRSYSKEWAGYVMVDELGGLILPNYITSAFKHLLKKNELREIRFHDLRHPYVKLKLKFLLTQHYRCIGTKVLDFPLNFKPVVGVNIHLVYKHICEFLCQGVFLFHCFCCLQSF